MRQVRKIVPSAKLQAQDKIIRQNMINSVSKHMVYIIPYVLYEYMDLTFKQLDNCMIKFWESKKKWDADDPEFSNDNLRKICDNKEVQLTKFVKSIPQNEKLFLTDTKRMSLNGMVSVEQLILQYFLILIPVLKKSYKFNNSKINLFLEKSAYIIKMYSTKLPKESGYVFSDQYIRDIFLEEQKFDMYTGDYVNDN